MIARSNDSDVLSSLLSRGVGINNTISISNTIKIIASIKNRSENGTRALDFGSNPHSKDDAFSRSIMFREFSSFAKINKIITIKRATSSIINGIIIIWRYKISSFD